jgi:hypothetical protein
MCSPLQSASFGVLHEPHQSWTLASGEGTDEIKSFTVRTDAGLQQGC